MRRSCFHLPRLQPTTYKRHRDRCCDRRCNGGVHNEEEVIHRRNHPGARGKIVAGIEKVAVSENTRASNIEPTYYKTIKIPPMNTPVVPKLIKKSKIGPVPNVDVSESSTPV